MGHEESSEEEGEVSRDIKAAIYARVSTTDQNNEIQVRELTEYISRRGWTLEWQHPHADQPRARL